MRSSSAPRRGRPRSTDPAETRQRIIRAAREVFGENGIGGTSIAMIAAAAGVTSTAVYHHFGDKLVVYAAVFDDTAPLVWAHAVASIDQVSRLAEAIDLIETSWEAIEVERPGTTPFLASLPAEVRRFPELHPLLIRRCEMQDGTMHALADFGLATGELRGLTSDEAFEFLRAAVMGRIMEGHNRGQRFTNANHALRRVIELLGRSASD